MTHRALDATGTAAPSILPWLLEWALPEPVTPESVPVVQADSMPDPGPEAVIVTASSDHAPCPPRSTYHWQQTFRAFPNAGSPRFLYPGDQRFNDYPQLARPRSNAWWKIALSRGLTAMPALVDLRATPVTLATSSESAIVRGLDDHVDFSHAAVVAGNRPGAPRPSLIGLDADGCTHVVGKYGSGAEGRSRLEREYQVLSRLRSYPQLVSRTPTPYALLEGHLGSMMVSEGFEGSPGPLDLDRATRNWLADCVIGPPIAVAASSAVESVLNQAERADSFLQAIAGISARMIEGARVPATVLHGDFVPWNLLRVGSVVRVFDWESGAFDGIPEWDRLYFEVRVGLHLRHWSRSRLSSCVSAVEAQGSRWYGQAAWRGVIALILLHCALIEEDPGIGRHLRDLLETDLAHWWSESS